MVVLDTEILKLIDNINVFNLNSVVMETINILQG